MTWTKQIDNSGQGLNTSSPLSGQRSKHIQIKLSRSWKAFTPTGEGKPKGQMEETKQAKLSGLYLVYHVGDQKTWFINGGSPLAVKQEAVNGITDPREKFFYQHTLKATLVKPE